MCQPIVLGWRCTEAAGEGAKSDNLPEVCIKLSKIVDAPTFWQAEFDFDALNDEVRETFKNIVEE